jgi:hypothetical protein
MPVDDDLKRFISGSFRSVWSLELLLLLKRDPSPHDQEAMISNLHGSTLVVSQALDCLVAAGLVSVDEAGRATYQPVTRELASLVDQAEEFYARKPDAVRRLIVVGTATGLTAFAGSFRFRKD